MKLAGTSWGCSAEVLRTSAIVLVYSVAEYCAPAWFRSAHCMKVNTQFNQAMRIVTETVRPTQVEWLTFLANVVPSDLRRWKSAKRIMDKVKHNLSLPLFEDITEHPPMRLKSRCTIWNTTLTNESV